MKVTTRFDYPAVPVGEKFTVRLMIGVQGEEKDKRKYPINLALAIDRSGSMGDGKIEKVLEATRLIAGMMKQQDIFSLVTFDDKVETIIPSAKGADLKGVDMLLNKVTLGGNTFLSGGYEAAACQVFNASSIAISRIVLLSDGQANRGITDLGQLSELAKAFRQKGATTSTFGVGIDFDEGLMTNLAESGGGNAIVIEDPLQAAEVFREELDMMRGLTDVDCSICFKSAMSGVFAQQLNTFPIENEAWVLGDVSCAEERFFILELSLPAFEKCMSDVHLGDIVVFSRSGFVGPGGKNDCCDSNIQIPINISVVDSKQFDAIKPDARVLIESALLSVARVKREARELARSGNFDAAANILQQMAYDLKDLGLPDLALEAAIDDLYRRADRMRTEREAYFDRLQDKRMMYEADMAAKGKKMHLASYLQRQSNATPVTNLVTVTVYVRENSIAKSPLHYEHNLIVAEFLKENMKCFGGAIPPYTYGTRWCLRERGTGRVFDVGSPWARANGFRSDRRKLIEAGIYAGRHLEAIQLPTLSLTRRAEDIGGYFADTLVVDISQFMDNDFIIKTPYQPEIPACDFLAWVYSQISSRVPANTYGKLWLLRDKSSGRIIDTGSAWAQSIGSQTDTRPLKTIGIQSGTILQVVSLPPVS
jgi:Ca-activated chloride channel homolog